MLCYLRALLFKNSWYHYVILQRWGYPPFTTNYLVTVHGSEFGSESNEHWLCQC